MSHDWGDGTLLQCTVVYCTCRMLIHDPMSWAPDGKALLHTYIYNIHISHICMLIHISVRISYTIYIHANIYTRHHIVHFISPPPPYRYIQVYLYRYMYVYGIYSPAPPLPASTPCITLPVCMQQFPSVCPYLHDITQISQKWSLPTHRQTCRYVQSSQVSYDRM